MADTNISPETSAVDIDQPVAAQPTVPQQTQPTVAPGQTPTLTPKLPSVDFTSQINLIHHVVDNMSSGSVERLILTGDTGLGKTSFIKQFAKLFGLGAVIIEIPHTVEEELINIPFIVYHSNGQTSSGADEFSKEEAELHLGKSHLATVLKGMFKVPNAQWAAKIKSYDANTQALIAAYEKENPGEIDFIRSKYDRILFLDEYYRKTTPAIRNILGGIMNGRIGSDRIPKGTYITYASNVADTGLDEPEGHRGFAGSHEFKAPTKEQWLNYTVGKATHSKVHFKQDVIDAFNQYVKDEHISYTDVITDIRTSPRRWSEILLYINNAYPFQSPEEFAIARKTITRQVQSDSTTKETSNISDVLNFILAELGVKSNIDPKKVPIVTDKDWRKVLTQQVKTAMEVGEDKKYVPVIQGLPGVGKTAIGNIFENKPYNLRFIVVECQTISRDSITGIPLPKGKKTEPHVEFGKPELYIRIMKMIQDAEDDYYNDLKEEEQSGELGEKTADQAFREYQSQKYKYLIFFDEINRVKDVNVFNSLRRLILEKEFNDQYKLPKESVVVGAMNPDTMQGTQPMTKHFRDAIELIDTEPNWKNFIDHLKSQVVPTLQKVHKMNNLSIQTAEKIIDEFPVKFTDKKRGRESNEFYINVGDKDASNELYFSPRDYEILFRELTQGINRVVSKTARNLSSGIRISNEELDRLIVEAAFEKMKNKFTDKFYRVGQQPAPGFFNAVRMFLNSVVKVTMTKKTTGSTLFSILDEALDNPGSLKDDNDFFNYLKGYAPAQFQKDFDNFLTDKFGQFDHEEVESTGKKILDLIRDIEEAVKIGKFRGDIEDRIEHSLHMFFKDMISSIKHDSLREKLAEYIANTFIKILEVMGK
jgi:MoxR-like ATPase